MTIASYTIYAKINGSQLPSISYKKNVLFSLLMLSILNWHFEILKWKILVNTFTKINYYAALSQSLAAHTAAITTPNKIGEYGAKALYYKNTFRKKILGLTFLGNATQLFITILFGVLGLYSYLQHNEVFPIRTLSIFGMYCIISSGIYYYLYATGKLKSFTNFLQTLSTRTLFQVGFYSLVRYLLFSFQYYLFLQLLGVENPYSEVFPLIWVMYFISSCIPSFSLADFAIKGSVALFLFAGIGIPESTIIATAFFMWVLNFAFPAVIGGYFVARYTTKNQLDYDGH